jgi:hypothetical protein
MKVVAGDYGLIRISGGPGTANSIPGGRNGTTPGWTPPPAAACGIAIAPAGGYAEPPGVAGG